VVGRETPKMMKTCDYLGLEGDRMTELRAFLRDTICLLLLAQRPIEIPFSGRILPKVVNDIPVPTDP
jgi:hypothetical protein